MKQFLLLALLFCLGFYSVAGQAKFSGKYLEITEATVQQWSPGMTSPQTKKSGGLLYEIKGTVLKTAALHFDSLSINGNVLPIEVVRGKDRNYTGPFSKGDLVLMIARTDYRDPVKVASSQLTTALAKSGKHGEGFITYRVGKKNYLLPVTRFTFTSGQTRNP